MRMRAGVVISGWKLMLLQVLLCHEQFGLFSSFLGVLSLGKHLERGAELGYDWNPIVLAHIQA